jgi:predicted DNA-binding WGR domain protein
MRVESMFPVLSCFASFLSLSLLHCNLQTNSTCTLIITCARDSHTCMYVLACSSHLMLTVPRSSSFLCSIQLLESDSSSPRSYYLWTRWGRVGQNGQNALQDCGADLSRALTAFHAKFTDKTKQVWAERKGFVAQPGKYAMAKRESAEGDYKPEGKSSSSSTALADPHEVAAPAIPTAPLFGSSPFFSSSQPAFGVQQVFNGQDVAKQPQMSNSNLFPYAQPAFQLASGGKRAHGQKQRFSAAHQQLQQQQQQQQQQQGWGGFSQGFHNGGLNSGPFGSLQPNAAQPSSNQFSFGQRAPFAFPNPAAAASSIPFGRFGSGFGNGPAFGTPAEDASLKAAMEASLMEYNVNQAKKVTQVLVGQAVSNGGRSAKEMEVEELERVLRESALEVQKSGGLNLAQHHTQSTGASNLRSDDGDAEDCIVVRSQVFSPSELANRLSDDSVLFLHPSDMQSLGLIRGDLAWLNSTVDAERGALLVAVDDHDIRKEHCSFHPHVSKVCFGSAAGKSGPSSAKLRDEDFVLSKCDAVPAAVSVQLLEVDSAGEPLLPSSIHTNPLPPLRDYLQPYFSTHYRPLTTRYQFTTPYKGDLDLIGMQPKHWRVVAMVEKDGKQTDKAVVEPETTLKFLSCAPPSSSGVVANQPAFECAVNENVEKKLQARQQAEAKVAAVVPAKPAEPVKAEEAKPAASVSPAAASKPAEASSEAAPAKALEDVIRSSFTPNSVDYFCPLRDTHHVYHAATFSHSVTLSQIHPSLNQSKYYVMQLLESNTLPHQFAVFFRWGRTPKTNPGQHMVEQCESLLDASAKFAQKFKDKTANAWPQTRETFQLHKGKYVIARDDDPIVNGSAAEASKPSASAAPTAPVAFADPSLFRQTKLNFAPAALSANPAAVAPESKPAPFAAAPPAGAPPAAAADAASSDSPVSSIPGGPSIHPALRAFQADLDEAQMSRAALVAEVEELRAMVKQSNESGSSVALTLAQADIAKLRAELAELKNADVGGLTTQVAQLTRQNASLLACLEQSTVPLQSEISRLKQENSTLRLKVTDLEFSFAVEQSLKQPAHRNANKFVCFHCANQPPQDRFEIEKSLMAEMEAKLAAGQAILPAATAQASPSPIAPAASSTSTSSSSSSSTTTNAPSTPPRVPASTSTSAHSPDTIASPPAVPPEVLSPTDWVSEDEEEQEQEEEGWELATKSPSPDATK